MFSASVELLLGVAYREATSRRHTHLTLEHLLYVLAHDTEAERILAACGADLPRLRSELDKFLQQNIEQFPRGAQKEPEQTLAFRRALQTAVLHVQSAGKSEVQAGDSVRIKQLSASPEVSSRLRELGFCEEQRVKLLSRNPNLICQVCNARLGLSSQLADLIWVEKIKPQRLAA